MALLLSLLLLLLSEMLNIERLTDFPICYNSLSNEQSHNKDLNQVLLTRSGLNIFFIPVSHQHKNVIQYLFNFIIIIIVIIILLVLVSSRL